MGNPEPQHFVTFRSELARTSFAKLPNGKVNITGKAFYQGMMKMAGFEVKEWKENITSIHEDGFLVFCGKYVDMWSFLHFNLYWTFCMVLVKGKRMNDLLSTIEQHWFTIFCLFWGLVLLIDIWKSKWSLTQSTPFYQIHQHRLSQNYRWRSRPP